MNNKNFRYRNHSPSTIILDETEALRLEYEFESTYLVSKSNNQVLMTDDFLGDPTCGLIDKENKWTIVAGTHLTLWTPNAETRYHTEAFKNIHSIRTRDKQTIEVLTDPWAEFSAIWELNLQNGELVKVANFRKYQGKAFTEKVEW